MLDEFEDMALNSAPADEMGEHIGSEAQADIIHESTVVLNPGAEFTF